jgi:hypothetical protein
VASLPPYISRIWWPLDIRPTGKHRKRIDTRRTFLFDRRFVEWFIALEIVDARRSSQAC